MEEKFIAAWEQNRAAALLLGIRMRPLDLKLPSGPSAVPA